MIDGIYRLGRPPWDTPPPAELRQVIEGPGALPVSGTGCAGDERMAAPGVPSRLPGT